MVSITDFLPSPLFSSRDLDTALPAVQKKEGLHFYDSDLEEIYNDYELSGFFHLNEDDIKRFNVQNLNDDNITDTPVVGNKKPSNGTTSLVSYNQNNQIAASLSLQTMQETKQVIDSILMEKLNAKNPNYIKPKNTTSNYVKYTPTNIFSKRDAQNKTRIIKIVEKQVDPMLPPKWKNNQKTPSLPADELTPILHTTSSNKISIEDQKFWKIPSAISNWKNPKGFTIEIDKRLSSLGPNKNENEDENEVLLNSKFVDLSKSLDEADKNARESLKQKRTLKIKLAQEEKLKKDEQLRLLAQNARQRNITGESSQRRDSRSESRGDFQETRRREILKQERLRLKQKDPKAIVGPHMNERRMKRFIQDDDRDISEKIALGLAKPTSFNKNNNDNDANEINESQFDSRLFNNAPVPTRFNPDQIYDTPLFNTQDAINSIYRPKMQRNYEDSSINSTENQNEIARNELKKLKSRKIFSSLSQIKEGPIQFTKSSSTEKDQKRTGSDFADTKEIKRTKH